MINESVKQHVVRKEGNGKYGLAMSKLTSCELAHIDSIFFVQIVHRVVMDVGYSVTLLVPNCWKRVRNQVENFDCSFHERSVIVVDSNTSR